MSTKEFYDRNIAFVAAMPDVEQAKKDVLTPGTRYNCVAQELTDPGSQRAIELGFGSKMRARYFASLFGEFEAADISATKLLEGGDAGFAYRDVDLDKDWPYEDESVDVLLAMMVFEHLFDPFHSFSELARILKPSGTAFVNLPNIGSIKCRWDLLRGRMPMTSTSEWFELRQWDGGHLHYFTIDEVRRVASLFGLRVRRIYPVGSLLWLKKIWPGLFCHEISYVLEKA